MHNLHMVFRADASTAIGTGHVMRCLALAREWRARQATVEFLCRPAAGDLIAFIEDAGFVVHRLPALTELPQGWQDDAQASASTLRGLQIDWLIVDHYQLDARWENAMRASSRHIMAIDDLADRSHDCDLLLDQNLYPDSEHRYQHLVAPNTASLLGPRYALLRDEFQRARKFARERDGKIGRILIFFGGSDPGNETFKAILALRQLNLSDIAIDVVVGAANPYRAQIEDMCRLSPSVSYICQAGNMAELMLRADVAIAAGGVASWERCCTGLPAIVIAVADNQVEVARALADEGAIDYLGKAQDVTQSDLVAALRSLLADPKRVRDMAGRAAQLADGCGTQRVLAAMQAASGYPEESIVLRYSTWDDAKDHFDWRNAPEVRAWSFDQRRIAWEEHVQWFRSVLANPSRHLLIGEISGVPVGVLRYDVEQDQVEVSVFLVSGSAGKGIGTRLLKSGSEWCKRHLAHVTRIKARIMPDNKASLRAFEKAGYIPEGEDFIFRLQP